MPSWTYDVLAEGCGPFRCDCGESLHPTEIVVCETATSGGCVIRCLRCAMAAGASDVPVEVVERSMRSMHAYYARALACAVASKSFGGVGPVAITPAPIPETAPPVTTPGTPAAIARQGSSSDHE
jgi:hypothetical protein